MVVFFNNHHMTYLVDVRCLKSCRDQVEPPGREYQNDWGTFPTSRSLDAWARLRAGTCYEVSWNDHWWPCQTGTPGIPTNTRHKQGNQSHGTSWSPHNILQHYHRRTDPLPQKTCIENFVEFGNVWFLRYASGQTDRHTHHNTSYSSRGRSNNHTSSHTLLSDADAKHISQLLS